MRNPQLHDRRSQSVLADVIRLYIETGEPVSSRAIAHRHPEQLSPATIRNVMAELEEGGYLYQPHTSAGRVPTAAAYRYYAQQIAREGTLESDDREWIERELGAAQTPEELMERATHVLSTLSKGLGIVVTPAISRTVLEHVRFVALPDNRLVVVLVSASGLARDKVVRVERAFTQPELDRIAEFLNTHYRGWTLDGIRRDLAGKIERERERYDRFTLSGAQRPEALAADALVLCAPEIMDDRIASRVYVEGTAQIATAPELSGQEELRGLLAALEEKKKLVALLTSCIETPEPVHIQIGVNEISSAGPHLALISAPYAQIEGPQGSLGVLGPMRMHYERAITAVVHVARLFGQPLDRS